MATNLKYIIILSLIFIVNISILYNRFKVIKETHTKKKHRKKTCRLENMRMDAKQVCWYGLFFNFFVLLLNWFLKQIYSDSQILRIPPIP